MASLRFVLGTALVLVNCSSRARPLGGTVVPLALELRVGDVDLLHPLLRILSYFRFQAGDLIGMVGARQLPVGRPDLLRRSPLRNAERLARRGEPASFSRSSAERYLLPTLLPVRGSVSRSLARGAPAELDLRRFSLRSPAPNVRAKRAAARRFETIRRI